MADRESIERDLHQLEVATNNLAIAVDELYLNATADVQGELSYLRVSTSRLISRIAHYRYQVESSIIEMIDLIESTRVRPAVHVSIAPGEATCPVCAGTTCILTEATRGHCPECGDKGKVTMHRAQELLGILN